MPKSWAVSIGKLIGALFYLDYKKRLIGFKNLKKAFPEKTNKELKKILRKSFINFGISIIETFNLDKFDEDIVFNYGPDYKEGQSSIYVGIHAGNWELYNYHFSVSNDISVIVKEQKNKGLHRFLVEEREKSGTKISFSVKDIIKNIKKGSSVGLVVDHGAEKKAPLIKFFNYSVPTPQGAVYVAKKFNKKIFVTFGYRRDDGKHELFIEKVIDPSIMQVDEILERINSIYEEYLHKYPHSYLWWHKRFKRRPDRKILILTDAKAGHIKQSFTFLDICKDMGYDISYEVVEIKPSNAVKRFILEVFAFCSGKGCLGCGKCLRLVLAEDIYKKVHNRYVDIVVSTGSSLAPVNVIYARSIGAKSVVILKPNVYARKFDMLIVPEHDRLSCSKAVEIKGVLSCPSNVEEDKKALTEKFNLSKSVKRASIFIGGSLDNEKVFCENAKTFIAQVKKYLKKKNIRALVTTSRRTPKAVDDLIEREFSDFELTDALVIANKNNFPFILGGFLSCSDIAFVTSDSISMVSECMNMGKITCCVCIENILSTHHMGFFATIENHVTFLNPPYKINRLNPAAKSLFIESKEKVRRALGKIL